MTAGLLLFNAMLEALLATVALRADWRRRENRLLALALILDAGRDILVGLLLTRGFEITDALPMQIGIVGRILIVQPVLEFTYAFPSGRALPAWLRWTGWSVTAAAAICALLPATAFVADHWLVRMAFFLPFFLGTMLTTRSSLRGLTGGPFEGGERPVHGTVLFRFGIAFVTWVFVLPFFPRLVPMVFTLDVLAAVATYAVVVHAVLKYRFFRVQGLVAEALLYGGLSLACLSLVVTALELVSRNMYEPLLRSLAFATVVLLPLGGRLLIARYAPGLETALLYPFDARRRLFNVVRERVLRRSVSLVDVAAVCELTSSAIASLSCGSVVLWRVERPSATGWRSSLSGPVLPSELSEYLQRSFVPSIHGRTLEDPVLAQVFATLDADALVAVRAQGNVLCAFAIKSRFIEQGLLDTATVLADNLGNRLAHKAMHEYAADLQSQLEASRRLTTLGSFVAAIAHDIRTPLTSVKMNLEMIRARHALDADTFECTDIALEELKRMNDYVSGMLDYVKPIQLRTVELEIQHLIEETARTLQPLLDSRRLVLRSSRSDSRAAAMVRADASRMKQVLVNLLENAADASAPGKAIDIAIDTLDPDQVLIRVSDQGHGIAEANLQRIFDPFFTTRSEGTGLGLAIVSKLVRAHDGEVRVASVPGVGSTFTVVLPAFKAIEPVLGGELEPMAAKAEHELPERISLTTSWI